jgi:hypothetical protein
MKGKLICIATFCAFVVLIHPHVYSQASTPEEINIFTRFKLQVYEDGHPTKLFLVGHLSIYKYMNDIKVNWQDVWISSIDAEKKMMLKPESNSIVDGSIQNVIVRDGHFSFDIVLEPERVMKISGSRPKGSVVYQIEGVGSWWIDMLKKHVKTEWRNVSEPLLLPYNEIF